MLISMPGFPRTTARCTPSRPSGGYGQCGAAAGVSRLTCSTVITASPSRIPSTAKRTAATRPGSTVIIVQVMVSGVTQLSLLSRTSSRVTPSMSASERTCPPHSEVSTPGTNMIGR